MTRKRTHSSILLGPAVLCWLAVAPSPGAAQPDASLFIMKPVTVELTAGEVKNLRVRLDSALAPGLLYKAELPPAERSPESVTLGFLDPGAPERPRRGRSPLEGEKVALVRQGSPLGLRITAGRCAAGSVTRPLLIQPPPGSPVFPVRLPVSIVVRPDAQACGSGWMSLLVGLVGGALTVYGYGMAVNSSFLRGKDLARRLEALLWQETGDVKEHGAEAIAAVVRRDLAFGRRAWAWLRANPLVFGLPGGAYHETVELDLSPRRDVFSTRISLIPKRVFHRELEKRPERAEGRLFATSLNGTRFFAVPHRGRIGQFVLARPAGDLQHQVVWLRPVERLLRNVEEKEGFAGWEIQGTGGPR